MENLVKQTEIAGMQSAGRVLPIWRGEYSDSAFYEQTDIVLYNNSSYIAKRDTTGNPPPKPTINSNAYWQLVAKGIIDADVSDATVALTYESENREELQSGETTDTLFSKIRRWYSEFATVTFSGKYSDLSGTPGVVSKSADGLVQKGNGQINKVWKTDADGNPAWRDDANTQTITGIKGNAETAYRTGNVNLTPANIGAVATSKVLSTEEQINANTDTTNVAGATAVKAMVSEMNSKLSAQNPFDIGLKRDYDYKTASGWKHILSWNDNNGRTGYLHENVSNGKINLSLTNERGDIYINGNSIANIVNDINNLKNGRNWNVILATQADGEHEIPALSGTEALLTLGYVYRIQATMIIPMNIFIIANGEGGKILFNGLTIEVIDNTHIKVSGIESDYLFRVFTR